MASDGISVKRTGSHGSGWKKQVGYISDQGERTRLDKRTFNGIRNKLYEWHPKTGATAAMISYFKGSLHYCGTNKRAKNFCNDPVVIQKFLDHMRCPLVGENDVEDNDMGDGDFEGDDADHWVDEEDLIDVPSNWMDKSNKAKRNIVRDLVRLKGKSKASWRKKPHWWPLGVEFKNPTGATLHSKEELEAIIRSFECQRRDGTMPNVAEDFSMDEEEDSIVLDMDLSEDGLRKVVAERAFDEAMQKRFLESLKRKLEDLQSSAWVFPVVDHNEIDLRQRSANVEEDLEPICTIGDGNCLYRAVSISMFGSDEHWSLLRAGGIAEMLINFDEIMDVHELACRYKCN